VPARTGLKEGKGKIERSFKTVRAQLLTRLNADNTRSLETLSRRLQAWVVGECHRAPHRGLNGTKRKRKTPLLLAKIFS
jgi:putative transposase